MLIRRYVAVISILCLFFFCWVVLGCGGVTQTPHNRVGGELSGRFWRKVNQPIRALRCACDTRVRVRRCANPTAGQSRQGTMRTRPSIRRTTGYKSNPGHSDAQQSPGLNTPPFHDLRNTLRHISLALALSLSPLIIKRGSLILRRLHRTAIPSRDSRYFRRRRLDGFVIEGFAW